MPIHVESLGHRPTMRRKSSAQNLLSSFKSANSSPQVPPSAGPGLSFSQLPPGAAAPMVSAGLPREWDVQSLSQQSESLTSSNGAVGQGTSVEMLRELVKKRIITLTYLRNVYEGRSHWFHTIAITRSELERVFPNTAMKNRTFRFAMLGMALAHLFDVKDPHDLLRGFSNVLNEYDTIKDVSKDKEDTDRPRMRLFRTKPQRRQAGGTDFALSYADGSDAPYLTMPHVPFPLDYQQTLLSLLDVLSEVYNKISKILGPSPFPSSGHHMMGPLGLLSPHPGVSYLFAGTETAPQHEGENSLWGIAHASGPGTPAVLGGGGATAMYGGALGSPPPSWSSGLGDAVKQIDNKLRKLIATLLKELDDFARAGIKDELASLDPLLRNVAVPEEPYEGE
ncbi:uncharacterized protein LAESUDRAFT_720831 [Laetiporus sulphureus 93-53]|uniref:Uncharacterized protein n=1 Tax=Laetiporus sulphureus 93-53 TaxID=1314785 RepID=A0A165HDB3_9APHY|nr:uncharacterized protein LAESUDRAFT_720831 [Laetiporus sulphureus 93-53]KZT11584.1 hypothetical protein LAESUDRAFT_720831 [Laetiporus sulphureus 93-53]